MAFVMARSAVRVGPQGRFVWFVSKSCDLSARAAAEDQAVSTFATCLLPTFQRSGPAPFTGRMFVDADISETAPQAPAADAWAERKLAILSELAEAGLEIALALKGRIAETAQDEPGENNARACADLARAFDRTSRAVRLCIALRDKLQKDDAAAPARPDPARETRDQRAERVRRIVGRVVRANFDRNLTRETFDRHVAERLYDTDITGDLSRHSIGELVARICADLGLRPPWLDFAEEAWAQAEIAERPPGSPYAAWPELPPEPFDPDDPDDDLWEDDDPENGGEDEPDDPGGGDPSPSAAG
jgi:hypothetical protein